MSALSFTSPAPTCTMKCNADLLRTTLAKQDSKHKFSAIVPLTVCTDIPGMFSDQKHLVGLLTMFTVPAAM